MTEPITVMIVDDHAVVRQGIRALLDAEGGFEVVGEAGSGGEAALLAADLAPDVVLMDLVMPEMDGVTATRLIKQHSPRSQVIVLTSYHEDEHIYPAIRAGALSYLLKSVGLDELVGAVRKAARGEATLHPHVAARLAQELHGASAGTRWLYDTLSEREREVLRSHRNWADQRADRRATGHQRAHGQEPRQQHPQQAPGRRPDAGGDLRLARGRYRAIAVQRPAGSADASAPRDAILCAALSVRHRGREHRPTSAKGADSACRSSISSSSATSPSPPPPSTAPTSSTRSTGRSSPSWPTGWRSWTPTTPSAASS